MSVNEMSFDVPVDVPVDEMPLVEVSWHPLSFAAFYFFATSSAGLLLCKKSVTFSLSHFYLLLIGRPNHRVLRFTPSLMRNKTLLF
jgi:hypothetical protein